MYLYSIYQQDIIKIYKKFLVNGFKDQFIVINIEERGQNKNATNEFGYFLESNLEGANRLFLLIDSNEYNIAKRFETQKYSLPKGVI